MEITDLLKIIVAKGASDLHLVVGMPPMMRLNGTLRKMGVHHLTAEEVARMVKAVLPPGKDISTDKDVDMGVSLGNIARFRLNVYYDHNGLCAAFRTIPAVMRTIRELGLPPVVERVNDMRRGMVLVAGVTGSGKSTTLAAIVDLINSKRPDHIITIEDPIEYIHKHKKCIISQREIGEHASTFADALKAALREDPNVILVGELRDLETISMAVTAAETGHLVLGSVHTRGAAQTIDRIIDIFPSHQQEQVRFQLADVLEMVISQVLLPSIDGDRRHVACEVMIATNAIRQMIRARKTHQIPVEIETGIELGMQSLEKSLQNLILTGKISRESALPWVANRKNINEL